MITTIRKEWLLLLDKIQKRKIEELRQKEIEQPKTGRKKKFCSANCKVEWGKLHPTLYSHVCQYCGKEFQSLASKAKYCCRECYVHDRFWRKEDLTKILGELENGKIPELIPLWIQKVIAKDYLNRL